jgi:flagellar assembly protein FliH
MKPLLNLEEFVDPAAAPIEEAEAEGDAAEQGRLAAYEQGYAAGWEDAARTLGDEQTTIRADLARNLAALALTLETARAQVLAGLGPAVLELCHLLLPRLARESLGAVLADELGALTEGMGNSQIILRISPQDQPAVASLIEDRGEVITLELEPSLAAGQVLMRLEDQELEIDMPRAVEALLSTIATCLNSPNRSRQWTT